MPAGTGLAVVFYLPRTPNEPDGGGDQAACCGRFLIRNDLVRTNLALSTHFYVAAIFFVKKYQILFAANGTEQDRIIRQILMSKT